MFNGNIVFLCAPEVISCLLYLLAPTKLFQSSL